MANDDVQFPGGDLNGSNDGSLSDAELIAATRAGDAGSFAVLYTRHVDAARACARRLVRSRSEADDLVAEGFAKVLGALRRGKGPDLAFRPYLLTSVRNALYDRTRRDSKIEFTDEPPEPVNAVLLSAEYEREERAMVAQAYAALPERWQMVLWHTDVEGRQPAEVAPLLGISANSVAALAYRAREGLRQAYLQAHVNKGINEDCRGTAEKLSAFVRDGLSARDRRGVEEHLTGCVACTALLAELQEANRSLKIVLIPALAGIPAAAYLSGMSGGGITKVVRRNPGPSVAGAVAAAAVIVFAGIALGAPGSDDTAAALSVPPVGSGRPTTTTTTTRPPTTAPRTTTTPVPTTVPFTPPVFDTAIPPVTAVPFNPNATTATTVRRTTTTTKATTTTVKPTTTSSTTTSSTLPGQVATTTTTTTTTTLPPNTQAPAAPQVSSSVEGVGPVYSGQSAYFRVRVSNAANGAGFGESRRLAVGPAEGVVLTFNLPNNARFIGSTASDWDCQVNGSMVRCLLPRLEAGATAEAMITIDVPSGATGDFTISPMVTVNGQRVDAPSTSRAVANGAKIADFRLVSGAALRVAGNSVLTCPGVDPAVDPNCDLGTSPAKAPAKSLGPAFENSSAAAIDVGDGGASVLGAYLVWQSSTAPSSSVMLVDPHNSQTSVAGQPTLDPESGFSVVADVTESVRAGGSGTYAVANITAGTGRDDYAGWALMVLVADGSNTQRAFTLAVPMKQAQGELVSATGLGSVGASRAVTVAALIGEGDRGTPLVGSERLTLNGIDLAGTVHPLPVGNEPANAFSSTALGAQPAGLPPYADTYGADVDLYTASVKGEADVRLQAMTGQDGVVISAVGLLYDL